jgi:hypothetical protein
LAGLQTGVKAAMASFTVACKGAGSTGFRARLAPKIENSAAAPDIAASDPLIG